MKKNNALRHDGPLVIATSSRALFDFEKESRFFHKRGLSAFIAKQRRLENVPLAPGPAFSFIRDMLALNSVLPPGSKPLVEAVVISSQHPDTGIRVLRSLKHYGMYMERSVFTGSGDTLPYLRAFGAHLLLSKSRDDVVASVKNGIAAALMISAPEPRPPSSRVNIALDGDGVLFSGELEKMFANKGLDSFHEHEDAQSDVPIDDGPYRGFLSRLAIIKKALPNNIRIALVTARGSPAHIRALNTLRSWGVFVDEALFLGGLPKGKFLSGFSAHIFFDDNLKNIDNAKAFVPSGLVV